jgi:hypothetical protein
MKRKGNNTVTIKGKHKKLNRTKVKKCIQKVSKRKRTDFKNKDNTINDQRIADLVNFEVKFGFGKEWGILNGLQGLENESIGHSELLEG